MELHDLRDPGQVGRPARAEDCGDLLKIGRAEQTGRDDTERAHGRTAPVVEPVYRTAWDKQHVTWPDLHQFS